MSTTIRQNQNDAEGGQTGIYGGTSLFAALNNYASVVQGDTMVAIIAAAYGYAGFYPGTSPSFSNVHDASGNSWSQVPGAFIRQLDGNGVGYIFDVWIAKNVAACSNAYPAYEFDFDISEPAYGVGVALYNFVGGVDVLAAGHTGGTLSGSSFSGPSLAAGNKSAVFLAMCGHQMHWPTPASPWSNDTDVDNFTNHVAGGEVGHYVGSGTQQPVFNASVNDNFSNVIAMTAVAVSDGSTIAAHDGSGEPFTRNECEPQDSRTIQFTADWPGTQFLQVQYHIGDEVLMTASNAKWHVDAGRAVYVY
jgi:hypothetical protein